MRSSVILVSLAVLASANAAVLQPRDACANGIKIRGSGSVSCSNNTCRACNNDGRCCTVSRPSSSSCNSNTPYLNFDTCKSESTSTAAASATTTISAKPQTTTGTTAVAPSTGRKSFLDRLRAIFGN